MATKRKYIPRSAVGSGGRRITVWTGYAPHDVEPDLVLLDELMADNPVALYRNLSGAVDGGVVPDSSGRGNNLQLWNPSGTGAKDGPSLVGDSDPSFDMRGGSNPWTPSVPTDLMMPGSVTLSFWIRPIQFPVNTYQDTVRKGQDYGAEIGADFKIRGIFTPGVVTIATQNPQVTIELNTTYHIATRYNKDAGTADLWVNGVLDSTYTGTPGLALRQDSQAFVIGTFGGANNGFNGQIDEVAVYNTVLSPERIAAHYAAGSQ